MHVSHLNDALHRDLLSSLIYERSPGGIAFPRGHILHDYLEARVMPKIIGPIERGDLQ